MEYLPGVYLYTPPPGEAAGEPAPSIFDVPRSGREYPPGFHSTAPFADIHFLVSHYVEELWALAPSSGSGLLYASFVNNWIDANRSEHDIDPQVLREPWPDSVDPSEKSQSIGMGLIHSRARGHRLYPEGLTVAEVKHRIEHYWRPYHDKLSALIAERRAAAGIAFHLSCHCMTSIGPAHAHDQGQRRKDFCLSDRHGTTSSREFIEMIAEALRRRGYSVTFNDPFVGAESVRLHGDPAKGIHSVQIETIKDIFMDDYTFVKRPDFDRIQQDLGGVAADIADYARSQAR